MGAGGSQGAQLGSAPYGVEFQGAPRPEAPGLCTQPHRGLVAEVPGVAG